MFYAFLYLKNYCIQRCVHFFITLEPEDFERYVVCNFPLEKIF